MKIKFRQFRCVHTNNIITLILGVALAFLGHYFPNKKTRIIFLCQILFNLTTGLNTFQMQVFSSAHYEFLVACLDLSFYCFLLFRFLSPIFLPSFLLSAFFLSFFKWKKGTDDRKSNVENSRKCQLSLRTKQNTLYSIQYEERSNAPKIKPSKESANNKIVENAEIWYQRVNQYPSILRLHCSNFANLDVKSIKCGYYLLANILC